MRKPIIGIDIDNTIIQNGYPDITKAYLVQGAKEGIEKIRKIVDPEIIIWTCRHTEQETQDAKDFLKKHEIEYDYFNENSPVMIEAYGDCRKLFCDVLIDDCTLQTVHSDGTVDWATAIRSLKVRLAKKGFAINLDPFTEEHTKELKDSLIEVTLGDFTKVLNKLEYLFPREVIICGALSEEVMQFYKHYWAKINYANSHAEIISWEEMTNFYDAWITRLNLLYNGVFVTDYNIETYTTLH